MQDNARDEGSFVVFVRRIADNKLPGRCPCFQEQHQQKASSLNLSLTIEFCRGVACFYLPSICD